MESNDTYLSKKHLIPEPLRREMENRFETYYSVIYKHTNPDGRVSFVHSTSRTKKQIAKDILKADFISRHTIEIGEPYEIGFNYDSQGKAL